MQEPISPQIAAIRERYKASLPDKAAMIADHIEVLGSGNAHQNSDLAQNITATHEILHKLAGSAGMYGYDDVSALSRNAMACTNENSLEILIERLTELKGLLEQHA